MMKRLKFLNKLLEIYPKMENRQNNNLNKKMVYCLKL